MASSRSGWSLCECGDWIVNSSLSSHTAQCRPGRDRYWKNILDPANASLFSAEAVAPNDPESSIDRGMSVGEPSHVLENGLDNNEAIGMEVDVCDGSHTPRYASDAPGDDMTFDEPDISNEQDTQDNGIREEDADVDAPDVPFHPTWSLPPPAPVHIHPYPEDRQSKLTLDDNGTYVRRYTGASQVYATGTPRSSVWEDKYTALRSKLPYYPFKNEKQMELAFILQENNCSEAFCHALLNCGYVSGPFRVRL
jgi:hypothetical protein